MDKFLGETQYVNFSEKNIKAKAEEIFFGLSGDEAKAKAAYEFVRDKIVHSFDIHSDCITAKASDVLKYKTGICHAKANLLAALLRSQKIPVGFCFQRLTLADDDSNGYVVHCFNAVYLGTWVKVDARGNKPGVDARFSLDRPILAYPCRPEYDEYFWPGIYAAPHKDTMLVLERAQNLQDVLTSLPDLITSKPDIMEENI